MANPEHLAILEHEVERWNRWREANPEIRPDLREADLTDANLSNMELSQTDFRDAELSGANLSWTNLIEADLRNADLSWARISNANLEKADLRGANLMGATLVYSRLTGADLSDCLVYGVSAWDLKLERTRQSDLIVCKRPSVVTIDNLEVAQFVYLLLDNPKIRDVIDTIGKKAVLILGRFTTERKAILDAIRKELRQRGYVPILFDFEKPASLDFTETISTLAHLARFVIADITEARSLPQELSSIVPDLPSVPVQPILLASQRGYAMFEHFRRYPWVLPDFLYEDQDHLLASLVTEIIEPAEAKVLELRPESQEKG